MRIPIPTSPRLPRRPGGEALGLLLLALAGGGGVAWHLPTLFPLVLIVLLLWSVAAAGLWWLHRRHGLPKAGLAPAFGLSLVGILTLLPAMPGLALRQTLWLVLMVGLAIGLFTLPLRHREEWPGLVFGFTLALLLLTLLIGRNPAGQGPPLWLGCCGFFLQPTAWHKAALVLWLAWSRAHMGPAPLWLALPLLSLAALAWQGDLGNLLLLSALVAGWLLILKTRPWENRVLLLMGLTGLAALGTRLPRLARRLLAWWAPTQDPLDAGYQILQALRALQQGSWWGRGPQPQPFALRVPLVHTDLIYALWAETWGWFGGLALLGLYTWLGWHLWNRARQEGNTLVGRIALGLGWWWMLQTLLVLGGSLRLLPLTGMPLPFVAYGGSELTGAYLGLVLFNLAHQHPFRPQPLALRFSWTRLLQLSAWGWLLTALTLLLTHAYWLL